MSHLFSQLVEHFLGRLGAATVGVLITAIALTVWTIRAGLAEWPRHRRYAMATLVLGAIFSIATAWLVGKAAMNPSGSVEQAPPPFVRVPGGLERLP